MQPMQLQSLTILKSNKAQEYKAQSYRYWQSRCFWELIVTFHIVVPTMVSFSNLIYFGWKFSNTNSIQLALSDIWYESFVLPEIEFKSEVLNHQLFTQLSLLVLFNFVATKNILPLSKPRENIWKTCGEIFIFAKTLAEASNFLGTASGTGLKTGLMGLARKSVHKIQWGK